MSESDTEEEVSPAKGKGGKKRAQIAGSSAKSVTKQPSVDEVQSGSGQEKPSVASAVLDNGVNAAGDSQLIQEVKSENPLNSDEPSSDADTVSPQVDSVISMSSFMFPMPPLDLESDTLEEKFRHFKFMHEQRMVAAKVPATDVGVRAASFIAALPEAAQIIVMNYNFATNNKDGQNIDDIIKVVCEAKKKKYSRIVARNRFLNRVMRPGESFSDFRATIMQLVEQCGYEAKVKDELLRDHIIRVHTDETFQRELLKLPDDTTLQNVIELCERHEDTVAGARELQAQRQYQIDMVAAQPRVSPKLPAKTPPAAPGYSGQKQGPSGQQYKPKASHPSPQPSTSGLPKHGGSPQLKNKGGQAGHGKNKDNPGPSLLCTWFCGLKHPRGPDFCPAKGAVCTKCGGNNHWEEVCRRPPASEDWEPRSEAAAEHHRRMVHAFQVSDVPVNRAEYEQGEDEEAHAVYDEDELLRHVNQVREKYRQRQVQVSPPVQVRSPSKSPPRRQVRRKPSPLLVTARPSTSGGGAHVRTVQKSTEQPSVKVTIPAGSNESVKRVVTGGPSNEGKKKPLPAKQRPEQKPGKATPAGHGSQRKKAADSDSSSTGHDSPRRKIETKPRDTRRLSPAAHSKHRHTHYRDGNDKKDLVVTKQRRLASVVEKPKKDAAAHRSTTTSRGSEKRGTSRSRSPSRQRSPSPAHRRRTGRGARHRSPSPSRKRPKRSPSRHEQQQSPTAQALPPEHKLKADDELDFEPSEEEVNQVSEAKPGGRVRTWDELVTFNGRNLRMKVDSGATICTISLKDFRRLRLSEQILSPPTRRIITYCKNKVDPLGEFEAVITLRGRSTRTRVLLLEADCVPLLSCEAGAELGFFVFSGASHIEFTAENQAWWLGEDINAADDEFLKPCNKTVSIELKPGATPIILPPRRVPLAMKDEVYAELQRMQKMGVISPVNDARPWCHAMVVARKPNGKVRICIDPRTINPWIEREYMQIPDIDGILLDLEKAKVFTLIDLQAAFWQVGVDDESARLLTFATPWGRYQYNRLPFGISIAPEIFHKAVVDLLQGIPGVVVYVDDIFIYAETDEEHDERYEEVKRRLDLGGFTWNPAKCHVRKNSVKFLGHIIGGGQVRPDPEKVQALAAFPEPRNRKDLKGFVGLVSWLRKFLPELNEHLSIFRPLLKERTPWIWTENEARAFKDVKTALTKIAPLMMIRSGEPLILVVDASSYGLGAALLQRDKDGIERPVYFASRLMNEAEKGYPQIDKEFLAIVWALERLDSFVYGQTLTVRTDHRPLLGIVKKSMAHMSTRQQRFVARAMRYTFVLEFVPGREMFIADFLSRSVDTRAPECRCMMMGTDIRMEDAFVSMLTALPISDELTEKVKIDAAQDAEYQAMLRAYAANFPPREAATTGEYWSAREELTVEDGLLYFQSRLVIPRQSRARFLESLHRGHVALSTMTKRAQVTVWWPGMTNDMKLKASKCGECQHELPMQRREPMLSFDVPPAPGVTVHSDYFELSGKDYLLIVDGFSGWVDVATVSSMRPVELIRVLRTYMMRHGVPRQFHSDQGSPYTSAEFRSFCDKWGIRVSLGSPKHPRGNAIAESYVKKVKRILRTAKDEDEIARAILAMHQTPVAPGRPSPAQLHLGRNLRDELHPRVTPMPVEWNEMREWKKAIADERKRFFDRGTRPLPELGVGALVLVRHKDQWQRAIVEAIQGRPRSYSVRVTQTGQVLQRNRWLLRAIPEDSSVPVNRSVNPSSVFQARPVSIPLRLLTAVPAPDESSQDTSRIQRLPNPQPTSPDQPNSSTAPSTGTPRQSRPTTPASPNMSGQDAVTPMSHRSITSSRSYASVLSPSSESSASSEAGDDRDTASDDGRASGDATPPPPLLYTRAGRPCRPPDRYSPEPFRR
jgi:transposase InsO family protein